LPARKPCGAHGGKKQFVGVRRMIEPRIGGSVRLQIVWIGYAATEGLKPDIPADFADVRGSGWVIRVHSRD
jgi:hypothetical protein